MSVSSDEVDLFQTNRVLSRVAYYIPNKFPDSERPSIQIEDDARQNIEVDRVVMSLSIKVGGATVLGSAAGAYYSNESGRVEYESTKLVFSYSFEGISLMDEIAFIELAIDFGKSGNQEEVLVEVGENAYRILKSAYDDWIEKV